MIAANPGDTVRYVEDGTRGMRRVRPTVQGREVRHIDRRNAGGKQLFASRENVRVVEAEESRTLRGAFCAIQKVCSINGDIDLVQAKGEQDLVHLVRAEGPDVVDGVGLIWAIKVFRSFVGVAVKRLILPESEIRTPELKALLAAQIEIDGVSIFALILRV